jgi:serine/threonine-protein kinase RsbW
VAETRPDVELRIPADSAFLSVLRTATAGLAARLDFTLDDIEDLRIAVGEACAMVLPEAHLESDLVCSYFLAPGRLTVEVAVTATSPDGPEYDSFAWQVLSTMATLAEADASGGRFAVRLTMKSGVPGVGS